MISVLGHVAAFVAGIWFFWKLDHWKWSGCRCGRQRMPWLYRHHEKEWIMWVIAAWIAVCAVLSALTSDTIPAIILGICLVVKARTISEHRKGKKSVLGRLWGRVVVTEHGTLAVES